MHYVFPYSCSKIIFYYSITRNVRSFMNSYTFSVVKSAKGKCVYY